MAGFSWGRATGAGVVAVVTFLLVSSLGTWAVATSSPVSQETLRGRVVGITDGDTLTVVTGGREVTVRIWGIDAPESGDDYSNVAKQRLSDLVFGKDVWVVTKDTDRYGRTVAEVLVGEQNAGVELVRNGLAWHYVEYAPGDLTLSSAEVEAKAAERNIWSLPNPLPPWERRAIQEQVDARLQAAPRQAAAPAVRGITYHGNRNSHVFHGPSCRYYTCKNCTANFTSRDAAIAAGYRPCKVCRP